MSNQKKLRVAVVGAGPAGQTHAFGYRNASMAPALAGVEIELAAIVDPDEARAKDVADRYGFKSVASDVTEILDDPSIDAVSVALPNFLSLPVVSAILRAGKHVFTEKPLGRTGAEAEELARIARESGKVAGVGFSYRRLPALARLRELVAEGRIGTPYFAKAEFLADYALDPSTPFAWRFDQEYSGAGTILDMGTHALDALEHVVGPISEVTSASFQTVVTERPRVEGGVAPVTNDDTALLHFKFEGGALGSMIASRVAAGETIDLAFEVYGSKGHVKYSFINHNEFVLYETSDEPGLDAPRRIQPGPDAPYFLDTMPMASRGTPTGYGEAFIAQLQQFIERILDGGEMDTSFEAAVPTMRIVDAAQEAAKTRQPVPVADTTAKESQ